MQDSQIDRDEMLRIVFEGQIAYMEKLVASGYATSWVLETLENDKARLRELEGRDK
jgi:hypothetical protein